MCSKQYAREEHLGLTCVYTLKLDKVTSILKVDLHLNSVVFVVEKYIHYSSYKSSGPLDSTPSWGWFSVNYIRPQGMDLLLDISDFLYIL